MFLKAISSSSPARGDDSGVDKDLTEHRHKQAKAEEQLLAGREDYCFVCKKTVKKCMVVHLKSVHKIPHTCEDFEQLYEIFARKEYAKPQAVIGNNDLYMDEFQKHLREQQGGSKTEKQARQHRRQAEAILKSTTVSILEVCQDVQTVLHDAG